MLIINGYFEFLTDMELTVIMYLNISEITFDLLFSSKNSELYALSKCTVKKKDNENEKEEVDSLIYYSSVNENTEVNFENELDNQKLEDETTIFRQIQNYTKNVMIKKTFDNLNHSLK